MLLNTAFSYRTLQYKNILSTPLLLLTIAAIVIVVVIFASIFLTILKP